MLIGLFLSLISSFLIAIYLWPKKKSKLSLHVFMVFLGLGYFLSSLLAFLILQFTGIINEQFFNPWNAVASLNGVIVMIAIVLFLIAIDNMGIAKASQFKSFQGSVGALLIMLVFAEWKTNNVYFLLIGILIMWLAALAFNARKNDGSKVETKWILISVASGLLFAVDALVKKIVLEQGLQWSQLVYVSFFTLLSSLIYAIYKEKNLKFFKKNFSKDALLVFAGGISCFVSTILGVISLNYLAGSIATTVRELSALWNVLFGIFLFKEISFKENKKRLILGFILVTISLIVLFLSKVVV